MSNQGEYPEDNRVGKHEPHDLSLTRRDLIKVSAATAATAVVYPHSTLAASVPAATPAPEIMPLTLKVNGKKLYELAREGREVERKPRDIEIFSLDILEMQLPRVRFRVHCSKGTYIRTLCQDIGEEAGCGGCMEELLRTRVDRFSLAEAHKLSEIEQIRDAGKLSEILIPVDQMFLSYPKVTVLEKYRLALANGNSFTAQMLADVKAADMVGTADNTGKADREVTVAAQIHDGSFVRVYSAEDVFYGIYQYTQAEKRFIPYKMFLPQ